MNFPSFEEFQSKCGPGEPVPVYWDVLADFDTPLSAYWKLAAQERHSFLLESVTGGEQVARYSLLGFGPDVVLRTKGRHAEVVRGDDIEHTELADGEDPLHLLERLMPARSVPTEGLPEFVGGAVGFLAYDFVRFVERVPETTVDDLRVHDAFFMITRCTVVFDHAKNLIRIVVLADPDEDGYHAAHHEIQSILDKLAQPLPVLPRFEGELHEVESNLSQTEFEQIVREMKEYIAAGDGFQFVPSQRFTVATEAHALSIYRCLRSLNPSPYMFIIRCGDYDVIGASPERLVALQGRKCHVRPIAGTRWRGGSEAEDRRLEAELLADPKERAEHIMLVDLGRNDVGRVSEFGSVQVEDLMVVERYSHVMHIVSSVEGELRPGLSAFDLVRATFPAGTVSGAPKVRAMEIIDEMEPTRRGVYAGAVGYFSTTGDMDTAITLRSILLKDGKAHVQAGCGVVFDSDPTAEYVETKNKARAPLKAIEMAQAGTFLN
jgi:anthranilate synthase component 1